MDIIWTWDYWQFDLAEVTDYVVALDLGKPLPALTVPASWPVAVAWGEKIAYYRLGVAC